MLGSCNLLSASALIDLVSEVWLRRLVEACRHSGCAVLLALSYDGRLSFAPRHADDTLLRDRFNQHQRRDKSLGPALGPAAAAIAAGLFADAGYRVFEAASDWRLTSEDRPLLPPLLAGWLDAVTEQDAAAGRSLAAWQRTRGGQIRCGGLAVTVGHRDLLALPS